MKSKQKYPEGVRVGRSSAGLGLFATRDYAKGERVIEYTGRLITPQEEVESNSLYLFELTKTKTIDGAARSNTARYINHSCVPNCEVDIIKGHIYISTIKKIKAGEEFAYDYGKEYFNDHIKPFGCRCPKHIASAPKGPKRAMKSARGGSASGGKQKKTPA